MNRSHLAAAITVAFTGAVLLVGVARTKGWRASDITIGSFAASLKPREKTPEEAIYAMLDAARLADPQAYLNCYTGQMKDQLAQTVTESSSAKFSAYLKASNAAVQGVALSPPQAGTDGTVKVRVEFVYRDRNEVQFFYLSKPASEWKIFKVDGAERARTLVPFGTAVTD
jgi:hypothetical protein